MGFTSSIGLLPCAILLFIPVKNTDCLHPFLKFLLVFASGALLGDALFHLIPRAHRGTDGDSFWVFVGAATYVIVEKAVALAERSNQPKKNSFHGFVELAAGVALVLQGVSDGINEGALFLQSQVSRATEVLLKLVAAVSVLAGTFLAVSAQNVLGNLLAPRMRLFTAGVITYVALASAVPELLDRRKIDLKQTVFRLGTMSIGMYIVYIMPVLGTRPSLM